jgi:hypothetical protein
MMKSLTGININLKHGASSLNSQATHHAGHSSNSLKNTHPGGTASRKKVRCAIRGDTMIPGVEYASENTSAQTPFIPAYAFSLPSPRPVAPFWNHGTSLAQILKLTPIPAIGRL